MPTLYIVMGSSGEYSDQEEWPIAAYLSEGAAKEHVVKATTAQRAFLSLGEDDKERLAGGWGKSLETPLDHQGFSQYDDARRYWYVETKLLEVVP